MSLYFSCSHKCPLGFHVFEPCARLARTWVLKTAFHARDSLPEARFDDRHRRPTDVTGSHAEDLKVPFFFAHLVFCGGAVTLEIVRRFDGGDSVRRTFCFACGPSRFRVGLGS